MVSNTLAARLSDQDPPIEINWDAPLEAYLLRPGFIGHGPIYLCGAIRVLSEYNGRRVILLEHVNECGDDTLILCQRNGVDTHRGIAVRNAKVTPVEPTPISEYDGLY